MVRLDPAQVGLQVEQAVVGQQRVDHLAGSADLGQLPHPGRCAARWVSRYSSGGRPSISASTTLANSTVCRCGSGSTGSYSQVYIGPAAVGDDVALAVRAFGRATSPIDDLAVAGQPAGGWLDLAERQRLAPTEEGVRSRA